MRVLVVCTAHPTHYFQLVPLAWAMRTAGHEVRVAVPPELADTVTGSGLTAVPVGVADWNEDGDPLAAGLYERLLAAGGADYAQHFDYSGRGRGQWSWEELLTLHNLTVATFYESMNNPPMIDDVVAFARHWRPDLVIREIYSFAGGIAAHVTGAAHARLIYGPDNLTHVRRPFLARSGTLPEQCREDPTAEWLERAARPHGSGFTEEILTGHWTVDLTPPSTRLDHGLHTVGMRYVPYNGPAVVADWLWKPPSRPRICLTGGMASPEAFAMGDMLAGLADLDVEIIATVDAGQAARLPEVPGNTRVVDFVPMHDLLPTCALVVHHGGGGTRATAEFHGVPQIIVSHGWDTVLKADRLAELGAALTIPAADLTPSAVRAGVRQVLGDPAFAEAAGRLRAELLAEPTANEIVPVLEQLTTKHRAPVA
jgi:protomycinolide IV desosaminyltransferase